MLEKVRTARGGQQISLKVYKGEGGSKRPKTGRTYFMDAALPKNDDELL